MNARILFCFLTSLMTWSMATTGAAADRTYINQMDTSIKICIRENRNGAQWKCSHTLRDGEAWRISLRDNGRYYFAIKMDGETQQLGLKAVQDNSHQTFRFVRKERIKSERFWDPASQSWVESAPLEIYPSMEKVSGGANRQWKLGVNVHKCDEGIHIDSVNSGGAAQGIVTAGEHIIAVNGSSPNSTAEFIRLLQQSDGKVELRIKSASGTLRTKRVQLR